MMIVKNHFFGFFFFTKEKKKFINKALSQLHTRKEVGVAKETTTPNQTQKPSSSYEGMSRGVNKSNYS